MNGKIIAITGGPRTGKSTLVRLLAERIDAVPFFEGEEDSFPKRIIDDIKTGERPLELILWFRNKIISDYNKAIKIAGEGKNVVLDTFWMTNQVYINVLRLVDFEKELLNDLSRIDAALLRWPDVVVSLYSNRKTIEEFTEKGAREFEKNNSIIDLQVAINDAHEKIFRETGKDNVLFVDRTGIDFTDSETLNNLVQQINNIWGKY